MQNIQQEIEGVSSTSCMVQPRSLTQIFKDIKQKMHLKKFIENIWRNNIYSPSIDFEIQQKEARFIEVKGWKINETIQNTILILDILITFVNYVTSTFQAFISGYQSFKANNPTMLVTYYIAIIIYLAKSAMSLTTQDVQNGIHYQYLTDIIKKQVVKAGFISRIALVVIILIIIIKDGNSSNYQAQGIVFFVLCIFKIFYLGGSLFKIQIVLVNTLRKERYWNLTKVFVFNLLYAHFVASIFLAMMKMDPSNNWYMTKPGIPADPSWIQLYLWSYYLGSTTMIAAALGDFLPPTIQEAIIVSTLAILSTIVLAYNITQIGDIILAINQSNQEMNSKIGLLRRMNKETGVTMGLSCTIEEYLFQQLNIQEEFQYTKHQQLIAGLPQQLKKKYYHEAQASIFRKLPFFMNLGSETLTRYYEGLTSRVYYPSQFIIKKSIPPEICIILKGQLGFCYRKQGSSLNETVIESVAVDYTKEQPIFLAKNILNKNEGVYFDIKATKYSYGVTFSTEMFLEILKESELDYHYYLMTIDMHQAQTSIAIRKCQYCPHGFHTKFECPRLHYVPFSNIVIAKHNAQEFFPQQRNIFYRKEVDRSRHAYRFKSILKSQEMKDFQLDINDKESYYHLKKLMTSYGDKKSKKNLSNRGMEKILRDERLLLAYQMQDENYLTDELDLDELQDFHHYFAAHNPEKLIDLPLKKTSKKVIKKS